MEAADVLSKVVIWLFAGMYFAGMAGLAIYSLWFVFSRLKRRWSQLPDLPLARKPGNLDPGRLHGRQSWPCPYCRHPAGFEPDLDMFRCDPCRVSFRRYDAA